MAVERINQFYKSPKSIILIGHSMGGIIGRLLASEKSKILEKKLENKF